MTDVEICNLALGSLGTAGISAFDDDSDQARACAAFYGPVRDAVMEDALWSFAKGQFVLSPDATAPLFGWTYRFLVPSDVAKVHRVSDTTQDDDSNIAWERQGQYILADVTPIYVTAVKKLTDPTYFSAAFCLALAARLGSELAVPLTENRALQTDLWTLYRNKITDAQGLDKSQGSNHGVIKRLSDDSLKWRR